MSISPTLPGNTKISKNKTNSDESSTDAPYSKNKFLSNNTKETRTATKNKYGVNDKAPFVVHVYTNNQDTIKQAHPLVVSRLITSITRDSRHNCK